MIREIWAIVLAAGESTRMKTNKLILPYKGKLVITTVTDLVLQSEADQVMLVLGAYRDEILSAIGNRPVKHCYNSDYKQGMLSSVQCGFSNLPENVEAAIIFLGDQPMISVDVINKVIKAYSSSEKGIVVPVCNGRRGHPVMISTKYLDAVQDLDPEEGLRALLSQRSDDVLEVDVPVTGILRDIDTMEDYQFETN